jgi:hexosaminidase
MPRTTLTTARLAAVTLACAVAACRSGPAPRSTAAPTPGAAPVRRAPLATLDAHQVVPAPASVVAGGGTPYRLMRETAIAVAAGDSGVARVGEMLATLLRPATGFRLPVSASDGAAPRGGIVLRLGGAATLGDEGYELSITTDSVRLVAARPAGLFRGVQTLRQLLPAGIEAEQSVLRTDSVWSVPPGRIVDQPRFAWRGGMLDVSRHFFTVDEVKQYVDLLALYKLNVMHLHLSDDQGWRIQIDAWPKLTSVGGATEVGGGPGGHYTKADYADIVRYAQDRYVTVVPEIDMPAHTAAAIAAYPELGCSRPAPDSSFSSPVPGLYTGIHVGFSALCHDREVTYRFVDDVVRELAAMTPGPYLHMGGDEVEVLSRAQYAAFVERVQGIVAQHGKTMVGWDEIARARLRPGTIAQMWRNDTSMAAQRQGAKLVVSPATKAYVDMKYTPANELGHRWAAYIELRTAYDWDPVTHFRGVAERDVLGVEAPLWTETVPSIGAAQFLLLPRLPAIAEVGWTAAAGRDWERFRARIAGHAPRWRMLGLNYYASPQVAWW